MPRRHVFRHVAYHGPTRPSARALDRKLIELGYEGEAIQWGYAPFSKRYALARLREAGVPCPAERGMSVYSTPSVLRTNHHRAGSGFWLCSTQAEVMAAYEAGASHAMEYIANAREFRVHIVHGRSIKLTEKLYVHGDEAAALTPPQARSHANGWHQMSPRPNAHKVSLRAHAKAACAALGASFGAVDILLKGQQFFVLEVNAAPALTDPNTDTCERYAQAFLRHATELALQGGQ